MAMFKSIGFRIGCVLFSYVALIFSAVAAETPIYFSALENKDGSSIQGKIFVDNSVKGLNLDFVNPRVSDESLQAVAYYYKHANENNLEGIKNLHYSEDGSYDWIVQELREVPDKFSGFSKLKSVQINKKYLWGMYHIFDVSWFIANDELVARWYESSICLKTQKCKISNLLLNGNTKNSLFSFGLNRIREGAPLDVEHGLKYKIDYYPLSNKEGLPLVVEFDFDWYTSPIPVEFKHTARDRNVLENKVMGFFEKNKGKGNPKMPIKLVPVYSETAKKISYFPVELLSEVSAGSSSYKLLGFIESKTREYILVRFEFNKNVQFFFLPLQTSERNDDEKYLYEDFIGYMMRTNEFFEVLREEYVKKSM